MVNLNGLRGYKTSTVILHVLIAPVKGQLNSRKKEVKKHKPKRRICINVWRESASD